LKKCYILKLKKGEQKLLRESQETEFNDTIYCLNFN
jgi:hypothetical protein